MPTFSSIDLHPALRGRLVTKQRPNHENNMMHDHDDDDDHHHHQPIATPMALLSCHPRSVCLMDSSASAGIQQRRPISYRQACKLRYEVSQAMISDFGSTRIPACDQESNDREEKIQNDGQCHGFTGTKSLLHLLEDPSDSRILWRIPTGSRLLDKLFLFQDNVDRQSPTSATAATNTSNLFENNADSGVPSGYVTQFAGPPNNSGKTQLALSLVASAMGKPQTTSRRVWYLSSNPNVTPLAERLKEIAGLNSDISTKNVLESTEFAVVRNASELVCQLAGIEALLETTDTTATNELLVIVDSISGCLSGDDSGYGSSSLLAVGRTLRRFARVYNAVVVVINGSVVRHQRQQQQQLSTSRSALGKAWSRFTDFSFWLEPIEVLNGGARESLGTIQSRVDKHPLLALPVLESDRPTIRYRVAKTGIQDHPTGDGNRLRLK